MEKVDFTDPIFVALIPTSAKIKTTNKPAAIKHLLFLDDFIVES